MKKLLYIDDDVVLLNKVADRIRERHPKITVVTCQNPVEALGFIDSTLDLLIIDLEMPLLDGKKLLSFAIDRGLDRRKIIIFSSRDADYLHKVIPMGACLCVLNKTDFKQLDVLDMVLASVERK